MYHFFPSKNIIFLRRNLERLKSSRRLQSCVATLPPPRPKMIHHNNKAKCASKMLHTLNKWCERKLVSQKWKQIKQVWTHFQSPKVAINVYLSLSKWWFSLNSQECQDSRNSRRRNLKLFLFFLLSISSFFKKKIFCQSLE